MKIIKINRYIFAFFLSIVIALISYNVFLIEFSLLQTNNKNDNINGYVNEFYTLASQHNIKLNEKIMYAVVDNDLLIVPSDILGQCLKYNGKNVLLINSLIINDLDHLKSVVFHELAHCVLNMKHSENETDLMYAYSSENNRINYLNTYMMFENSKSESNQYSFFVNFIRDVSQHPIIIGFLEIVLFIVSSILSYFQYDSEGYLVKYLFFGFPLLLITLKYIFKMKNKDFDIHFVID